MNRDRVLPFQLETNPVRGRLVRLGPALAEILHAHAYPAPVSGLLGETVALGALLASSLKYEGQFILQTQSDGPIRMLVADLSSDGAVRACARFDPQRVAAATPGAPVPHLLGAGTLAFTVDQGPDTQRYQGIAELDGATLAECVHHYFRKSEQLDSAIVLASEDERAAGLMIQRMPAAETEPEESEENWRRAVALAGSLRRAELLDTDLPAEELLRRLFHEEGVRVFEPRPLRARCRCSEDKVAGTLKALPRGEVMELLVDGKVTVTCEFCSRAYVFDEAALTALLAPR